MDNLSPHKGFRDPQSTKDIPGVTKHRPIPRRAVPLTGTKSMKCPRDGHLPELFSPHHAEWKEPPVPPSAQVLAWLATGSSLAMISIFWSTSTIQRSALEFLLFAVIHVCGVFAGILSSGRVRLGYWAIFGLYLAYFVSLVVNHVRG